MAERPAGEEGGLLGDLAALLLAGSAEGVFLARETIVQAGRRYGVRADLLVLPDQFLLTVDDGTAVTTTIVEAMPGLALHRLEKAKTLAAEVRAGLDLPEARRRLDAITAAPDPYPWWLRIIGVVLFCVGFAPSVAGGAAEIAITLVLALVMAVLFVGLSGRRWEPLLPLVGGFTVAVLTFTVFSGAAERVGPVLLMVPALFVVIPGDYLSAAAAELAVGRISAGAIRLVWAAFLLVQLIVAVIVAAQVTGADDRPLFAGTDPGSLPVWAIVVAWVPFTIGLALAFSASLRNVPLMTVLVIGTYLLYAAAAKTAGDVLASLIAGAAAAAAATLLARPAARPPRQELMLGPFFTLTVGSLGLRGVTQLISGHPITAAHTLTDFLLIVPAVALGMVAGFLAIPPSSGSPPRDALS